MRVRLCFLLGCLWSTAVAAAPEVPVALGVDAGVISDVAPARQAPSMAFHAGIGLPGGRFALVARVDGWTLADVGSVVANSELTTSLSALATGPIAHGFFWSASAGPSVTFLNRAGAPTESRPGLLVLPSVGLATRRRTLAIQVGAEALLNTGGLRLGATAGVVYTFF